MERTPKRFTSEEVEEGINNWGRRLAEIHRERRENAQKESRLRDELVRKVRKLGAEGPNGEIDGELLDEEARSISAELGRAERQAIQFNALDNEHQMLHRSLRLQRALFKLPEIHQAAYWGDLERVKVLAEVNVGNDLNRRVHVQSSFYEADSFQRDPRNPNMTPLNLAIWSRKLDVIEFLVQADNRKGDSTVIDQALNMRDPEILNLLVWFEDVDDGSLHRLIQRDGRNDPVHMEMLLLLIHGGADVKCEHSQEFNGRDTCFYFNPLMYLYDRRPPDEGEEQGALAFLKVLLAYGADPNMTPDYEKYFPYHVGRVPAYPLPVLHAAARWGQKEAVEVLLEAGANPFMMDKGGRTAVDWVNVEEGNLANPCKEVLVRLTGQPLRLMQISRKTVLSHFYEDWENDSCSGYFRKKIDFQNMNIPREIKYYLQFKKVPVNELAPNLFHNI